MRHRPAQRKQEQTGCSVVVPLGNTTIHCVEINCLMNNVYQTSRNKQSERADDTKPAKGQEAGKQLGADYSGLGHCTQHSGQWGWRRPRATQMDRNALQNCPSAKGKKCKCSMSKLATYRTPGGDGYVYNPTAGMLGPEE